MPLLNDHMAYSKNKTAYYTALATTIITVITFVIAVLTPPLSGPFCREGCFEYPYTAIASRFPRDYYWMIPAIILNLLFVAFMACIHQYAQPDKKLYSLIALLFGLLSSGVFVVDYFVQLSVVQPSLLKGETDGIALITQYNPHGVFIALEEIGYLLMSLAMFCAIPVFPSTSNLQKGIRTIFFLNFTFTIVALFIITALYGLQREYRFEVIAISLNWMALIVSGLLLSRLFKNYSF
jgi:hypothetical protein